MIRELYEGIKARFLRNERRIAPLKQTGRVFEPRDPGKAIFGKKGPPDMKAKGKFKMDMKVTRKDGTVEYIKNKGTIKGK